MILPMNLTKGSYFDKKQTTVLSFVKTSMVPVNGGSKIPGNNKKKVVARS